MIRIAPSTNPSPENKLLDYALLLQQSGADILHCDVMDGKFVTTTCLPYEKVYELSFGQLMPLDVHLMVEYPRMAVEQFLNAKVNYLTVHYESFNSDAELLDCLHYIQHNGVLAGLSIKPTTNLQNILPLLKHVNLLMIMSVQPGKSGQTFLPETLEKFETVNKFRKENNLNFKLEADGGVNDTNIQQLHKAGVDIAVVGSYLYNAPNKKVTIDKLKNLTL